jgi:hypothetical protein
MNVTLKPATATTVQAKPAMTGAIFGATPAMFKSNFDYQLVRGVMAGAYGEGGAFGELYSTARRVVDRDVESWTVEWTGAAERVEAIAHSCLEGGTLSVRARRSCEHPLLTNGALLPREQGPQAARDLPSPPLMLQAGISAVRPNDRGTSHRAPWFRASRGTPSAAASGETRAVSWRTRAPRTACSPRIKTN